MFYADTALFGALSATECGLAFFGSGHVLFATDMRMNRERQRRLVAQLDTTERRVMFEVVGRLIGYVRGEI